VFTWKRVVFPNAQTYDEYKFGYRPTPIPSWNNGKDLGKYKTYAAAYLHGNPLTQIVNPFAPIIRGYQRYVWLPGTVYGLILLTGLGGIVLAWRRLGGDALLPWAVSFALILIPAATATFDYRYVLPAVPFACLAAVMAFSPGTAGGNAARRLAGRIGGRRPATVSSAGAAPAPIPGPGPARAAAAPAGSAADPGDDERDLAADGA
jgi:hypothetical protein